MNSIRKFAYATVLTLSALSFGPSLASAQDAAGSFTLSHEVHWQRAIVPTGKYRFTIDTDGPAKLLTLRKSVGNGAAFMMVATELADSLPADVIRLVLGSRNGGILVQHKHLPDVRSTPPFEEPARNPPTA